MKEFREKLGITQEVLAKKVDVTRANHTLSGKRKIQSLFKTSIQNFSPTQR